MYRKPADIVAAKVLLSGCGSSTIWEALRRSRDRRIQSNENSKDFKGSSEEWGLDRAHPGGVLRLMGGVMLSPLMHL